MKAAEYINSAHRELERWPGVDVRFEKSRKHQKAFFAFAGAERFVVFPTSGSDSLRGTENFLRDVRAELRALGASRVAEERSTAEHRERRRAAPRAAVAPVIDDPRQDGLAPLRALHASMQAQPANDAAAPKLSIWGQLLGLFAPRTREPAS
ncbi:MAG TPA: hypothetical protein PLS69_12260 [Terricaulis sp.]|nr:hypothetical protein [Terricaulis sp.]